MNCIAQTVLRAKCMEIVLNLVLSSCVEKGHERILNGALIMDSKFYRRNTMYYCSLSYITSITQE